MLPSHIVNPGKITERPPSQTLSDTTIGFTSSSDGGRPASRACGSDGCPGESNIQTPGEMRHFLPIEMLFATVITHPWPIPVPLPTVNTGRPVKREPNERLHFPSKRTSSPITI